MELHRQEDAVSQAREEEAAAAKEITGEENVVMLDVNVGPGPLLGSILDQTRPWLWCHDNSTQTRNFGDLHWNWVISKWIDPSIYNVFVTLIKVQINQLQDIDA